MYYQNCSWFVGSTIFGFGFGDITAYSNVSVIIVFLCGIFGTFNFSIIVVMMINILLLNSNEKKALSGFNRVD